MTDETRAAVRRVFEAAVRAGGADTSFGEVPGGAGNYYTMSVFLPVTYNRPELTQFQLMCLSGLIGDQSQLESAVVDWLLDAGHEFTTAAYEKGKADATAAIYAPQLSSGFLAVDIHGNITSEITPPDGTRTATRSAIEGTR